MKEVNEVHFQDKHFRDNLFVKGETNGHYEDSGRVTEILIKQKTGDLKGDRIVIEFENKTGISVRSRHYLYA